MELSEIMLSSSPYFFFYGSINVSYKLDTYSNSNQLPFDIFKILFPKSANKTGRQLKTCKLKLMHNEKPQFVSFL